MFIKESETERGEKGERKSEQRESSREEMRRRKKGRKNENKKEKEREKTCVCVRLKYIFVEKKQINYT